MCMYLGRAARLTGRLVTVHVVLVSLQVHQWTRQSSDFLILAPLYLPRHTLLSAVISPCD